MKQQTLAQAIEYSGIGLHSGQPVNLRLVPAPQDSGIVFKRTDLPEQPTIRALPELVTSTVRATTLSEHGAEVFTVEHLLAALSMMQVDNCLVEMSSPEPPVADGSAAVYVDLIQQAGLAKQAAERRVYAPDRSFSVYKDDIYLIALPYDGYRISFTSINPHPLLGTQYFDIDLDKDEVLQEIAPARTVAFEEEIAYMQKHGLGLGGTLENVVVFGQDKILSVPRFADELIRHKILDVIGDLYLLGSIKAHIIAMKSGHAFNSNLSKQIQAYRLKGEQQ